VAGCPGVARLAAGPVGTYLPRRVVPGVAVRALFVRVAVAAWYGPSLGEVARRVQAAARDAAPGRRVDVVIEDIEVPVEWIVDRVAKAVAGCPGVARLAAGPVGTYLPHRVVPGVAVGESSVRVAVVAWYGPSLGEVARRVQAAARDAAPGRRVDVMIEDIEVPVDRSRAGTGPRG